MLPPTSLTFTCKDLAVERIHRYRHNPYSFTVLESLPPAAFAAPIGDVSASSSASDAAAQTVSPRVCPPAGLTSFAYAGSVGFKYGVKEFYAPFRVAVGDAIVTEGDRGEDLGYVRRAEAVDRKPVHVGERALRIATPEDIQIHHARADKEKEALQKMRIIARQVRCLAYIQDIMYQLDGHKITVIIARESRSYVDFRRLQRAAFDVFRCRVWCAYLDEIIVPQVKGTTSVRSPPVQRSINARRSHSVTALPDAREVCIHA